MALCAGFQQSLWPCIEWHGTIAHQANPLAWFDEVFCGCQERLLRNYSKLLNVESRGQCEQMKMAARQKAYSESMHLLIARRRVYLCNILTSFHGIPSSVELVPLLGKGI
jgi:hypothetical protein